MNTIRKFSVKPKEDGGNVSSTQIYPVLYVSEGDSYDYFAFRGDNGSMEMLKCSQVTIEDVEL